MIHKREKTQPRKEHITVDVNRYGGKQVVIFDNRIIAHGNSTTEALRQASKRFPKIDRSRFILFFVPKTSVFIYLSI